MHKGLKNLALLGTALLFSSSAFAIGLGYSTFPLQKHDRLLGVESTAVITEGGGIGVQGRYSHKFDRKTTFEGGLGMGGGDQDAWMFLTTDTEIIPDYANQPRISVRGSFENVKEYGERTTIFSVAPVFSKGFVFWGHEGFPYVALPIGVNLNGHNNSYQTTTQLSMGINGHLPIRGYEKILGNVETFINLKNRYSGALVSLSFPWR